MGNARDSSKRGVRMQLKIAEEKDIPILVELLKEFVENNINVNQTFDEETVTDLLHDLHENKEALVLTNDSLSGILLAIMLAPVPVLQKRRPWWTSPPATASATPRAASI